MPRQRLQIPDATRHAVLQRLSEGASYTDISLEFALGFHIIFRIKKAAGLV